MVERVESPVLSLLKVPAAPTPPAGAPGSLKVFRASVRYLRYQQVLWALRQGSLLLALIFGVLILMGVVPILDNVKHGANLVPVLQVAEVGAWIFFLVQLPLSYALLTLDYRQRWYMVTDRSLRVREGIWSVREKTMTFANIQALTVEQGPLQRLLGLADVKVESAGGGGGGSAAQHGQHPQRESAHEARFRGVDNAAVIRDLVRERVRQYRDAGLGDHDDRVSGAPSHPPAVSVAAELLSEVRALRTTLGGKA